MVVKLIMYTKVARLFKRINNCTVKINIKKRNYFDVVLLLIITKY